MAVKLVQLRGFCRVMQDPRYSIKDTAQRIHVEVSALSRQLSSLEDSLNIVLFDRSEHKKIKPTKEGELFYKEAIQYMNGIDGLFENFNEHIKNFNNSHLNIALHQMAATHIFPPILEKMLKLEEFKDLEINIYSIPKDEAIEKIINREIDLAFYINASKEKLPVEIETIKSIPNHISLVFNKNHKLNKKDTVDKEDLEKCKFLRKNVETASYSNVYNYLNSGLSNIRTVSASFETILEIIKHTDAVSTVPELFLKNKRLNNSDIENRNIDHLLDMAFFNIMMLKNCSLTKPMLWVIDEFKKLKME